MGISNLSNSRLWRSLFILIFLIVTIFLYGLYSTTTISVPEIPISELLIDGVGEGEKKFPTEQLSLMEELNNKGEFGLSGEEELETISLISSSENSSTIELKESTNSEDYLLLEKLLKNTTVTNWNKMEVNAKTSQALPNPTIETEQLYVSGHLNDEINLDRICPQNGLSKKLLILITSALGHEDSRMSIRQTWGHYGTRRDIGLAFILGRGTNETLNKALSEENYLYGDLIRGNFIDSYENLTLKTISALEWTDQHCHRAKYILKTDDDMFINIPLLLSFLEVLEQRQAKLTIFGCLAKNWKPVRNKKSKYYVSRVQYRGKEYPSFTTGPAYLMTADIIHNLYVRSLQTVYLKLEDVFVTGIVALSLGIKRSHVSAFLNRRIELNACKIMRYISVHMIRFSEKYELWQKLHNQTAIC